MKEETNPEGVSPLYHKVLEHLVAHAPCKDLRHHKTLAWMVSSLIQSGSSHLSEWIVYVESRAQKAQSTERRFSRWLHNRRVVDEEVVPALLEVAFVDWDRYERVSIVLDTSLLWDQYCLIRLALLYRGRAIPLDWEVIEHGSASVGFDRFEKLLQRVYEWLDRLGIKRVLFLADRGFADTQLMGRLRQYGWNYRIRIKSCFGLYSPAGELLCKAGEVVLAEDQAKYYHNVRLTKQLYGPVHVALANPSDSRETWFVVSNEPTSSESFVEYGSRFQIEGGFKDDKSGGFQLADSHLRDPHTLQRLLLVMAIATLFLVAQGVHTTHQGLRQTVDPHYHRGLSYFRIGWNWILKALSHHLAFLQSFALFPGPDPYPLSSIPHPSDSLSGMAWAFRLSG